ncbi:MAG: peptidylprolyl isomerase [Gemmatimonadaceae bacterium]|nr:peptidylprolyl isomerase [Gemmatimonadaceae bacterium]
MTSVRTVWPAWRRRTVHGVVPAVLALAGIACGERQPAAHAPAGPTPDSFRVVFTTSRGPFVVQAQRAWSPHGVDRFYRQAGEQFFDENRFFRVLPNFIAQFGANDDPGRNARWEKQPLPVEPPREKNRRGTVSFAQNDPASRTHQLFVNLKDNRSLDDQHFTPIGRVVEGMAILDSLYDDYGDTPRYHLIATQGNKYLARMFPKLDFIRTARLVVGADSTKR